MFGGDKVWQIASSKVVGEKMFGECLQQRCVAYYYYVIITCTVHARDYVCNQEVCTRMSSFVVDSVIRGSMAQSFSFATAIMDDVALCLMVHLGLAS